MRDFICAVPGVARDPTFKAWLNTCMGGLVSKRHPAPSRPSQPGTGEI